VFSSLSAITSPNAVVVVTPAIQAAMIVGLNSIQTRDSTNLSNDLKDTLDVFIIANASTIINSTTIIVDSSNLNISPSSNGVSII
jgi:hypothetical protein